MTRSIEKARSILTIPMVAALCLAWAPALFAATDLPALGDSLVKLAVGPSVGKTTPAAPGHLRLAEPTEARIVRAGDGRAIGWFFADGRFEYDVTGTGEKAIRTNFDRAQCPVSSIKEGEPAKIKADFALWLTPGATAPAEVAGEAPPLDGPASRLVERFRSTRIFGGAELEPALLLAESILANRPKAVVALLDVKRSYYFYTYDPETDEEILSWGYEHLPAPNGLEGWLTPYRLDRRPLARTRKPAPLSPLEIRKLDVDIEEVEGDAGRFTVREEVSAKRPAPLLRFTLEELDFGFETSSIRITLTPTRLLSVSDASGKPLPFFRIGNGLLVVPPASLAPGASATLTFQYLFSLRHPWGDQYWRLADQDWYPVAGDIRANWLQFHAKIAAKKPFLPFASGRIVSRSSTETHNLLVAETTGPIVFPSVLAGKYFPGPGPSPAGKSLTIASYAMEREEGVGKLGKLVGGFLELAEKRLGPNTTNDLVVAEIRDWGWAQAPSGFIDITQEAFNPVMNAAGGTYLDFFRAGVNERIAHEVSHAWFGHVSRLAAEQDQWLEESFAEYMAGELLALAKGKSELDKLVGYWKARGAEVPSGIALTDANLLHWDQQKPYRINLLYGRGPYLLHVLRQELGDQTFFTILRSYLRSNAGKLAGTEDLIGLMNFVTKKDWHPWFEKHVWGAEMP